MKQYWRVVWTLCLTDDRRNRESMNFNSFNSAKEFAREKACEIYIG